MQAASTGPPLEPNWHRLEANQSSPGPPVNRCFASERGESREARGGSGLVCLSGAEVCSVGGAAVGEEEGALRAPRCVEQLEALEVVLALEQPAAVAGQSGCDDELKFVHQTVAQ
jgi:hypothetical protein